MLSDFLIQVEANWAFGQLMYLPLRIRIATEVLQSIRYGYYSLANQYPDVTTLLLLVLSYYRTPMISCGFLYQPHLFPLKKHLVRSMMLRNAPSCSHFECTF
jgi:hypothetical protein